MNKLKSLNIKIILPFIASLILLAACGKTETIMIGNVNMTSYMNQLNGRWDNADDVNKNFSQLVFMANDDGSYSILVSDQNGLTTTENITNIIANDDYMKTYSIEIDGENKYSFYMTDSNNIVFENNKMQKFDEYFNSCFASLEGSWIDNNGVKVTFFTNKNSRYVNLTDGFGTFNKRIFDIDKANDGNPGNYIMTKEGTSFISFYYNLNEDNTLTFYDYNLHRNEDTTEYESLKVEEIIEEEDSSENGYDLTTYGTSTGYQVADCSNDIPTDTAYIFVGDSRFVGMDTACNIHSKSNQYVVAKVGQGYYWLTNEAIKQVDEIISTHSASSWVVIFNFGINDLGNISKYKAFYNSLSTKPYKIVLVSVNPVGNYPSIPNSTVEGFNMSLQSIGYTYVDTYSYLMNERGYVTPDGLHYNNSTYQDIYKYIIYSVKGIQLSDADKQAIADQYHGQSPSTNSTSNNSASDNSASNNAATQTSDKKYGSIEEYYSDGTNSVEFSNKIQEMKSSSTGIFSNITITVNGNTIVYNYVYEIDVPEVDWNATDKQLESNSNKELIELHNNSGYTGPIKLGYIYYDKNGNSVHSYYNEG